MKIKIDAEAKSAESRMQHLQNLEILQQQHENALKEFADSLQSIQIPPTESDDNDDIENARQQLRDAQSRYRNSRAEAITEDNEQITTASQENALYISRIAELESKKRALMKTLKDEEKTNKQRAIELTVILDEQETSFQKKIEALQNEMKKKDEKYQEALNALFQNLDRVQVKRKATVEKRKEKIEKIQQQIIATETEFKEKLRQANRVAEKLKIALINANIRKSQQLELERQRSHEQQDLLRESYAVQQNIAKLSKELERAKQESAILRRELSAKIGPRRTASLFA
jgi:DNA repair exonuclease SbcCD ATPase subunit